MIRTLALALTLAACGDPTPTDPREQCEAVLYAYCDGVAACNETFGDNCRAIVADECAGVTEATDAERFDFCVEDVAELRCVLRGGQSRPAPDDSQSACVAFYAQQGGAQ